MTRTLLQQALDALEPLSAYGRVGTRDVEQAALQQVCATLKQALAAPQPEPVLEPYLCIAPACGNDCSGCNKAISPQTMRDYAILHAATLAAAPAPAVLSDAALEPVLWAVTVNGRFHPHFCAKTRAGAEGLHDALRYETAPCDLKPMQIVALSAAPAVREPQEHVGWCRYVTAHEKATRLVLCDSDAPGAFRVYRGIGGGGNG